MRGARRSGEPRQAGFTLVEVMLALAILFTALVVLIRGAASNVYMAERAHQLGVATNLARGKMWDIEEDLTHEGFQELDKEDKGDFAREGWPSITWKAEITKIKLPGLTALTQGANAAEGEAKKEGEEPKESFLGGLLGGGAAGLGGGAEGMDLGANLLASQYQLFVTAFEASIRKVTLTLQWQVAGRPEELKLAMYVTDPTAVDRALGVPGMGGGENPGQSGQQEGDDRGDRTGGPGSSGPGRTGTGSGTGRPGSSGPGGRGSFGGGFP
jgi:general secretion pathway protein I